LRTFDYTVVPASEWALQLEEFASGPTKTVALKILWGDHEKIRGVRDFHSKPRLKLEKLFTTAQAQGLSVDISFGFSSQVRSFPDWVWNIESKAKVPIFNEQGLSRWDFAEMPSLKSEEIRTGFLEFLEEAISIIKLHLQPEGSVRGVSVDWGIFERECPLFDATQVLVQLKKRYQTIRNLNGLFQTHFNDFESAASPAGFRTLTKKRPWLAFWDYQMLKKEFLNHWEMLIRQSFKSAGLEMVSQTAGPPPGIMPHTFILDDTFLLNQTGSHQFFPILFQGELDPFVVRVFRLAELLVSEALQAGEPIVPLSSWVPAPTTESCSLAVQNFIPQRVFEELRAYLERGGRVYFPFGLPKWNETMESLAWRSEYFKGVKPSIIVGKEADQNPQGLFQRARTVFQ